MINPMDMTLIVLASLATGFSAGFVTGVTV